MIKRFSEEDYRKATSRQMLTLECEYCHATFQKNKHDIQQVERGHRKQGLRFCSMKCFGVDKTTSQTTIFRCATCNRLTTKRNSDIKKSKSGRFFCNSSCAASFNGKIMPKRKKKIRSCPRCHKDLDTPGDRGVCLSCRSVKPITASPELTALLKSMTIAEYLTKMRPNLADANKFTAVRGLARGWHKELLTLGCAICGYKHVQLCHIKSISKFPSTSTLDEINGRDNVIQLCPNHHWELDHGKLQLQEGKIIHPPVA